MSTVISVGALCSASEIVLSGGYAVSAGARELSRVIESTPFESADDQRAGWRSTAVFEGSLGKRGKGATLTTYAICAEVSER